MSVELVVKVELMRPESDTVHIGPGSELIFPQGVPCGTAIGLIAVPSHVVTPLCLQFLVTGLKHDEGAIAVLATQEPKEFTAQLSLLGIDVERIERAGLLRIIDWTGHERADFFGVEEHDNVLKCGPELINIGIAINKVTAALGARKKRAYVQIISSALRVTEFSTVLNFVLRMNTKFRQSSTTSLFLLDRELIQPRMLDVFRMCFDGIIELEQIELEGKKVTRLLVTSMKNVPYSPVHAFIKMKGPVPVIEPEIHDETPQPDPLLEIENALKIDPYNPMLWTKKAEILMNMHRIEDALIAINMATEPDFELKNQYAWKIRAEILKRMGRTSEAELCRRIAALQSQKTIPPPPQQFIEGEGAVQKEPAKEGIEKLLDIMLGSVSDEEGKQAVARVLAPLTGEKKIFIEHWLSTLEKEKTSSDKSSKENKE